MHQRRSVFSGLIFLLCTVSASHAATRLNSGTVQWASEARSGRSDIFFIGDSIVNAGTGGWSNGFAQAAMHGIGVAGSGVQIPWGEVGETQAEYTGLRVFPNGVVESASVGMPSLSPGGKHYRVSTDINFVAMNHDSVKLDPNQAIDWHLFVAGTTSQSAFGATRSNIVSSPASTPLVQTLPAHSIPTTVSDQVYHFSAASDNGDWDALRVTSRTEDAALYYTKVVLPAATGVAVSGWGRGGATAQYFRENYYDHSRFTAEGRTQYMRALVAGDSGFLNVAIAFGVNDANQGVTISTFEANVRGLISDVRRDWSAAGFDPQKLSFTLLSTYQVNSTAVPPAMFERLDEYRSVLDGIATNDSGVSFVDMWACGPTSEVAVASGYLSDPLHPSQLGTQVYGQILMNQLMPEIGDANIDGHVNFDDLLLLSQSYSRTGTWANGDFDGSGLVDFDDLLKLAQHYDASSFNSDWALATSLVPEPGLSACAVALIGTTRRRRQSVSA